MESSEDRLIRNVFINEEILIEEGFGINELKIALQKIFNELLKTELVFLTTDPIIYVPKNEEDVCLYIKVNGKSKKPAKPNEKDYRTISSIMRSPKNLLNVIEYILIPISIKDEEFAQDEYQFAIKFLVTERGIIEINKSELSVYQDLIRGKTPIFNVDIYADTQLKFITNDLMNKYSDSKDIKMRQFSLFDNLSETSNFKIIFLNLMDGPLDSSKRERLIYIQDHQEKNQYILIYMVQNSGIDDSYDDLGKQRIHIMPFEKNFDKDLMLVGYEADKREIISLNQYISTHHYAFQMKYIPNKPFIN